MFSDKQNLKNFICRNTISARNIKGMCSGRRNMLPGGNLDLNREMKGAV